VKVLFVSRSWLFIMKSSKIKSKLSFLYVVFGFRLKKSYNSHIL